MKILTNPPIPEPALQRCLRSGPSALSLRECIAVLIHSEQSQESLVIAGRIVEKFGPGLDPAEEERAFFLALEGSAESHLQGIPGLDLFLQAKILTAFELGRRYTSYRTPKRRKSKASHALFMPTQALSKIPLQERFATREWLGFVPLYRNGELGGFCRVESGVRTHVNTDPAELFSRVLALRPRGFYLFHNHPSGMVTPSKQDQDLTDTIGDLSRRLAVPLLGHWVVGPDDEHWIKPE